MANNKSKRLDVPRKLFDKQRRDKGGGEIWEDEKIFGTTRNGVFIKSFIGKFEENCTQFPWIPIPIPNLWVDKPIIYAVWTQENGNIAATK